MEYKKRGGLKEEERVKRGREEERKVNGNRN